MEGDGEGGVIGGWDVHILLTSPPIKCTRSHTCPAPQPRLTCIWARTILRWSAARAATAAATRTRRDLHALVGVWAVKIEEGVCCVEIMVGEVAVAALMYSGGSLNQILLCLIEQ